MRPRSLTTTLALAFAITTLAVFGLVGSVVYLALERQVKVQDDMDIVLAARHTRRLTDELQSYGEVERFRERLESQVLGNVALSMKIADASGHILVQHNAEDTLTHLPTPSHSVPYDAQITQAAIESVRGREHYPFRMLSVDVRLQDGSLARIIIVRNMRDRWILLDHYRDRLQYAGGIGVLLSFAMGFCLVRRALRPLREVARSASTVTSDKLHTRIAMDRVPKDLEALVRSLNGMLAGLETSFQRLSQSTADLAHDMRTPLANMRGATEVALARTRSVEEYQALLASNLEECHRLSRMIENVIFLARAEHPQFARHMREFDAIEELRRIAEYFEGLAEDAGVHISTNGAGRVTADLELFRRAVSNLIANAVRYTPRQGIIKLSARPTPAWLCVCVENDGAPIAPEMLERVFDRFYRGDPSRGGVESASGSAGLGLAIVRTIMELHGGKAHAESDAHGTRFVLSFPIAADSGA
ncbi:heavy metal sensor histidine kinase [Caballeronia sp. GAOx1]|uniref:heavy metal sensor histidine kinase n=1 Tax=Caballeronia sp. GAOx1 TaxID=2921761 RepID=UPI002027E8C3|nr:heavy metal sensor histidine kinase [Caballeronia sp. GAOx1]